MDPVSFLTSFVTIVGSFAARALALRPISQKAAAPAGGPSGRRQSLSRPHDVIDSVGLSLHDLSVASLIFLSSLDGVLGVEPLDVELAGERGVEVDVLVQHGVAILVSRCFALDLSALDEDSTAHEWTSLKLGRMVPLTIERTLEVTQVRLAVRLLIDVLNVLNRLMA